MVLSVDTDRRNHRVPYVNYALIAIGVLVFVFTNARTLPALYLWPHQPQLYQFLSYQFLHVDWTHLLGNMLFLLVFGNSVEDRFGHVGYLLFYLASGILAGMAHIWPIDAPPVVGASGAIAGVTGAYLALFAMTTITVEFYVGPEFEVAAIALILFRIATDAAFALLDIGGVAYTAHLAGYIVGFAAAMALVIPRLLPRSEHDLFSLITHRRRVRAMDRMRPWEIVANAGGVLAPDPIQRPRIEAWTKEVDEAVAVRDMRRASPLYADLLDLDPGRVLAPDRQLEVVDALVRDGRYRRAAHASELFLARYPDDPHVPQASYILGLVYGKLGQPTRARELLQSVYDKLGAEERKRADELMAVR